MQVIVIGAGVAGTFAAAHIAEYAQCLVLDKNEKVGKKLYLTGKGRCNLTNDSDIANIQKNVMHGAKFLTSALHKWSAQDTIAFAEQHHCPCKVERGNRVFPMSDKSSDVIRMLENAAKHAGAEIRLQTQVQEILVQDDRVCGVIANGEKIATDCVVVATGGISYPSTGSTGDGYRFAKKLGLHTVEPRPALVPMLADGFGALAGLTLKNVAAWVETDGKRIGDEFGEMLFTHTGVSGPIVLSLSSRLNAYWENGALTRPAQLVIDLKPALAQDLLDRKLVASLQQHPNAQVGKIVGEYLPRSLGAEWLKQAGVAEYYPCHSITKVQRNALAQVLKRFVIPIRGLMQADCGIITAGGVDLAEINPSTMESKKVHGLYFIGEVLDIDALTGGYNIQIALSTAYACARAIGLLVQKG